MHESFQWRIDWGTAAPVQNGVWSLMFTPMFTFRGLFGCWSTAPDRAKHLAARLVKRNIWNTRFTFKKRRVAIQRSECLLSFLRYLLLEEVSTCMWSRNHGSLIEAVVVKIAINCYKTADYEFNLEQPQDYLRSPQRSLRQTSNMADVWVVL